MNFQFSRYRQFSAIVWLTFACAASANDLQYDWQSVQKNTMLRESIGATRECMRAGMRSFLMAGVRDSKSMTDVAIRICATNLKEQLKAEMSPQDIDKLLRSLAEAELSSIPGLTQTDPESRPRSDVGSKSKAAQKPKLSAPDDQFQRCLSSELKIGKYTLNDQGDSMGRLLKICSTTWYASVNSCIYAGGSKDDCMRQSLVRIQKSIANQDR